MPLDAYSLCPGGTGKKIKFCCNDFLPELQKIDRMLEGEQFLAALKHADRLIESEPGRDRECLLALRSTLLRLTNQPEAAKAAAALFVEKFPENQAALAEQAIQMAERDPREALRLAQKAVRIADGTLSGRTYECLGIVGGWFVQHGFVRPARALFELQAEAARDDRRPVEVLAQLSQAVDIPLLLRDEAPLEPCPEGASYSNRFSEALESVALGDWQTGADRLQELTSIAPDEPVLWRNLATVRSWLADNVAAIEALRRYAALRANSPDGFDDAVEAEAEAMLLSDDPLGDRFDMLHLVWNVNDVERAQELLASPRFLPMPFDKEHFSDGETPPPKAAFIVLDRPMPEQTAELSLESLPILLCQGMLFGRQTDREARLELMGVGQDDLPRIKALVKETLGDSAQPEPTQETMGRWSASKKLLGRLRQPHRDAGIEKVRSLLDQQRRDAILDEWPDLPLGVLDGRSARQAASDPAARVRLLASILVLESWWPPHAGAFDFDRLRAKLGLPELGPIDPSQQRVEDIPAIRLTRIRVDGLPDEQLVTAFYRATAFGVREALRKFSEAIIGRPTLADSDVYLHAFATLSRTEEDVPRALGYVERGRKAAEAKKQSSASWDLMELSLRFAARDMGNAMRLVEHLQKQHINEPGIGEALVHMLVDVGLLNPDGTPAHVPQAEAGAPEEPPAAESSGLWTPDSAEPSGGGGKLWTPG